MMNNNLLITGASGFIGSHLVEEALQQGFEVFAGIRPSSSKQYLQDERIHFSELNLSSPVLLKEQLSAIKQLNGGFSYVIHNAGITRANSKADFFAVNCGYTQNLADALSASEMPLQKFVLISSLAAYGPGNPNSFLPVEPGQSHSPISAYGKSKSCAEDYIRSINNFPYLIINPTAVYGPRDKDFLQFVQLIQKGFEPYIGTNKQMVSMIYVKDLARAVISLLKSSSVNTSYIVSDEHDYDKEELGNSIKSLLHKKTVKIKIPALPVHLVIAAIEWFQQLFTNTIPFLNTEKVNEISSANWLCNSSALWNNLSSAPHYTLDAGMKETVEWYQQNNWL
jgi:nucleoside-diphosphate-sugar epimerase